MSEDLVRYDAQERPLTATQIKAQVQLIQEVMAAVMKKDVHYGTIPGTAKPTLYKPGSEAILTTFRIAAYPKEIEDLSTYDEIRYRVKVHGIHQTTGVLVGVGIGECSSSEEKYKWRKPVCDDEYNETPEDRRRIVWKKYDGNAYQQKQVRTNPPDVANTILKMAKKRGQIDMTLTATAASDVFDQDLEDMDEATRESLTGEKGKKPPVTPPQKKSDKKEPEKKESKSPEEQFSIITPIANIESKDGVNPKTQKPYTIYAITDAKEVIYKGFDKKLVEIAEAAWADGKMIKITYTVGQYGNNFVNIEVVGE